MANDRLYLRCRQCGATIFLSKHCLTPWHIDASRLEKINEFLYEHWCCKNAKYDTSPNSFELVSEMGDGFPEDTSDIMYHHYDIFANDYHNEVVHRSRVYQKEKDLSDWIEKEYRRDEDDNSNT